MNFLILYIGIDDWIVVKELFQLVESDLPCGQKLSTLNTFMMFLMKVHLNL